MRWWLLAVSMALFAGEASAAEPKKTNVLFIAIDDLRPELGTYGHPLVKSPNIDALAKQGVQFNRAYCQLALCNPSRASLLSGRRPETLRVFDLKTFVRDGNPDVVTLPEFFKNNGYVSLGFGKIFHSGNGNHDDPKSYSAKPWKPGRARAGAAATAKPAEPGTDPHANDLPYEAPDCADEDLPDGMIAQAAIQALRDNRDKPFFIAAGFVRPHLPFVAPKRYWDLYDANSIQLAPNQQPPRDAPAFATNDASELRRYMGVPKEGPIAADEQRKLIHGYYACVSYVDAQVGKLLAELEALGLRGNTIILLWGDHGYHLGEQGTWNKRTNWEIAARVPMIIAAPGQAARGSQTHALVELVDVYPTLVELCGLAPPEKLEGTSFAPLLTNPDRPWKRAAFTVYQKRIPELGGVSFGRAMRAERYRLIEWSAARAGTVRAGGAGGAGGAGSDQKVYELYDHETDPQEQTNIANRPENRALLESLTKQLHAGWRHAAPEASAVQ